MTPEQLATLVNFGAAGAVVWVVYIFLKFIKERDADWRTFFTSLRTADEQNIKRLTESIDRLVTRIESLEERFGRHDSTEMELLRDLIDGNNRRNTRKVKE